MRPPALLRAVVQLSLPRGDRAELLAELDAMYGSRRHDSGRFASDLWYARQAGGFLLRVGLRRMIPGRGAAESAVHDMRLALRSLRHEPTYVASLVATVAVSAGVLTAVYTAANWLLFREPPGVHNPAGLVTLRLAMKQSPPRVSFEISNPDLGVLQQRIPELAGLAALTPADVDLSTTNGLPVRIAAEMVSANYFSVLGTRIAAGRAFVPEDEMPGTPAVVVSSALARTLAVDPAGAVGMMVRINGADARVVGVAEANFRGAELPGKPLLWLPLGAMAVLDPSIRNAPPVATDRSQNVWRRMIGRLAPGATPAQVLARSNAVMEEVRREMKMHSYSAKDHRFQVFAGAGLDPAVRESVKQTLGLLLGAATFLQLLAIANLANLTITRAIRRRGTVAIRVALGASRGRILRGLAVEVALLGTASGVAALVVAAAWGRWFQHNQLAEHGGSLEGMHLDLGAALFALTTALVAIAIAYLRPLIMTRRMAALERELRGAATGASAWSSSFLVGVQMALSVVLLVAATLLGRTVINLRRVDLGFNVERILTASFDPSTHGYDLARVDQIARGVAEHLATTPGVLAAGVISPVPLRSGYITAALYADPTPEARPTVGAGFYVTPGFLRTLGAQVLAGDRDWRADSGTIVITRKMLSFLLPGVTAPEAIGREVRAGRKDVVRIAAVIENVQLSDLTADPPPMVFRPLANGLDGVSLSVWARTTVAPMTFLPAMQRAINQDAPDLSLYGARSARDAADLQFSERRIMAVVASALGILGVLLAAIGLYGVLANAVAAGQRSIAIRAALGATPWRTLLGVMRMGIVPAAAGSAVGLVAAIGAARLLKSQLYGLGSLDVTTYGSVVVVTATVACVACLLPAYRATRVSLVEMLRAE